MAPPMFGSGPPFLARAEAFCRTRSRGSDAPRAVLDMSHVARPNRYAAGGRLQVFMGKVKENRAAAPDGSGPDIEIQNADDIVEVVLAPEIFGNWRARAAAQAGCSFAKPGSSHHPSRGRTPLSPAKPERQRSVRRSQPKIVRRPMGVTPSPSRRFTPIPPRPMAHSTRFAPTRSRPLGPLARRGSC